MTSARRVTAPIGIAFAITATIVAMKRASMPHGLPSSPSGAGIR